MNRRGFLQCLVAVSGALAAGIRLPAPASAATPSPQQNDLIATVLEMLKQCRAITYERSEAIGGMATHRVEYLYEPNGPRFGADVSEFVRDFPQTKKPVSIAVHSEYADDAIDITHLGGRGAALRHIIEVVWA